MEAICWQTQPKSLIFTIAKEGDVLVSWQATEKIDWILLLATQCCRPRAEGLPSIRRRFTVISCRARTERIVAKSGKQQAAVEKFISRKWPFLLRIHHELDFHALCLTDGRLQNWIQNYAANIEHSWVYFSCRTTNREHCITQGSFFLTCLKVWSLDLQSKLWANKPHVRNLQDIAKQPVHKQGSHGHSKSTSKWFAKQRATGCMASPSRI